MTAANAEWSNYSGNAALAYLLGRTGLYLALFETDPTPTFVLANEISGNGYERQPISFGSPSGRAIASSNAQTFSSMPAGPVGWLVVCDDIATGNMIAALQLVDGGGAPAPISVLAFGNFLCAIGDVAFAF